MFNGVDEMTIKDYAQIFIILIIGVILGTFVGKTLVYESLMSDKIECTLNAFEPLEKLS